MKFFIQQFLNLGVNHASSETKIRLTRQVNGLNLFFCFIAASVGVIEFNLSLKSSLFLGWIQVIATLVYLSNLYLTYKGQLQITHVLTIHVFEWQMFTVMLLTGFWQSIVLFNVLLYPLLAALVEVSIIRHFLIGLIQVMAIFTIHLFFPFIEAEILSFSNVNPHISEVFRLMALTYFPFMATMIMQIIFSENLRSREKQKEMLNQITFSKKQIENYAEALKDETQKLKAEVEIARKIQTMVLPTENEINAIEELEISAIMNPAEQVGGDYYDIIKIQNIITIAIGDVTGHGLSSGVIMLMAQTAIRTIAEMGITDTKIFLALLNKVLYANIRRIEEDRNMTLAILSYKNREFVVSGQHESIIICRKNGTIENYETMPLGFYVGFLSDISRYINSMKLSLEKDDLLILYSDGITEAVNSQGKQFGLENLYQTLIHNRNLPAKKIKFKLIKELYNFIGSAKIDDDISLIVIKQK